MHLPLAVQLCSPIFMQSHMVKHLATHRHATCIETTQQKWCQKKEHIWLLLIPTQNPNSCVDLDARKSKSTVSDLNKILCTTHSDPIQCTREEPSRILTHNGMCSTLAKTQPLADTHTLHTVYTKVKIWKNFLKSKCRSVCRAATQHTQTVPFGETMPMHIERSLHTTQLIMHTHRQSVAQITLDFHLKILKIQSSTVRAAPMQHTQDMSFSVIIVYKQCILFPLLQEFACKHTQRCACSNMLFSEISVHQTPSTPCCSHAQCSQFMVFVQMHNRYCATTW
jgi:hypothetical protein